MTVRQTLESKLSQGGFVSVRPYQTVTNQPESGCLRSFSPGASVLFSQGTLLLHSFTDMHAAHHVFGDCYCLLVFYLKWCIVLLWFLTNSRCHWQAITDIWSSEWQWRSGNLGFLFGFTKTCVITLRVIVSIFFRDGSSLSVPITSPPLWVLDNSQVSKIFSTKRY